MTEITRVAPPSDPAIEEALAFVPRARFFTDDVQDFLYDGRHGPAPDAHAIIPVPILVRMLQATLPGPATRALVVPAGRGYLPAILARLVRDVVTFAPGEDQAVALRKTFAGLGIDNVEVIVGDPLAKCAQLPPFEAILVPSPGLPGARTLRRHLQMGGRLVLPAGTNRLHQALVRITRRGQNDFPEERLGEIRLADRLGDLLAEMRVLDRALADRLSRLEVRQGTRAGTLLRDVGGVSDYDLLRALAIQRGLKFAQVDAVVHTVDLDFVRSLPRTFVEHRRLIPVVRTDRVVTLAVDDPDHLPDDVISFFHPQQVEFVLLTPADHRHLRTLVDLMLQGKDLNTLGPAATADPVSELGREAEARFIRLFDTLLMEAINERASDIHIERYGERVRLRIRVDGDLRDLRRYELSTVDALGLVNVIKIRADLDIAERRLPQGGRIRIRGEGKTYDLRVQTQPTLHGEHAVIRLLPQDTRLLTIEDLGFPPRIGAAYRRLLDSPSGMVLVVGPTGSGKSTTLYAGLQILSQDSTRKVITVEDPIEYSIENVQQSAARPEIGFGFADAMRAFVREDPDVILVGEIRDPETALEAIRASQTGHLVFSTLHCNDTTDAVQRLLDLGMHPNSIASELLAVMSQRLAKRVCDGCRGPATPDPGLVAEVFPDGAPPGFACFKGAGCNRCGGYGTRGRVAVVEFLRANSELRNAISRRVTVEEFRGLALRTGLLTMRDTALELVASGVIPFEEMRVILQEERLRPEKPAA